MHARPHDPPAVFAPAPIGRRVQLVTMAVVAISLFILGAIVWVVAREAPDSPSSWICALLHLGMLASVWSLSRIREYRIADGAVVVSRLALKARFPLAGLVSVAPDDQAMHGAWKTIGNDGLGAIAGRFRSQRLGRFRAYLTDPARSVVLRWPDRCVVISPAQTAFFVASARAHLDGKGAG